MAKKTKLPTIPRVERAKAGLNQSDFWSRIGVTQSGGSRYESGRKMPRPVAILLQLVYVQGMDIDARNFK